MNELPLNVLFSQEAEAPIYYFISFLFWLSRTLNIGDMTTTNNIIFFGYPYVYFQFVFLSV